MKHENRDGVVEGKKTRAPGTSKPHMMINIPTRPKRKWINEIPTQTHSYSNMPLVLQIYAAVLQLRLFSVQTTAMPFGFNFSDWSLIAPAHTCGWRLSICHNLLVTAIPMPAANQHLLCLASLGWMWWQTSRRGTRDQSYIRIWRSFEFYSVHYLS